MPTTKHTPGPWTVEPNVEAGGILHLAVTNRANGEEWMVCSVTPMRLARDVDQANAQLIAAAPSLLLAAEATLLFHSPSPWYDSKRRRWEMLALLLLDESSPGFEATTETLCGMVRAAIAKATKETP